jgi:hypothetical protein
LISQFLIKNLALTDFAHSPLNGFLLVFMVNRLQIGFILLLIPTQLISGEKYWLIILAFLISQFNLFLISRWINNSHSAKPVQLKTLLPKQLLYPSISFFRFRYTFHQIFGFIDRLYENSSNIFVN